MKVLNYLKRQKDFLLVYTMFVFIYMTVGTYNPYITLFYGEQGLTPAQIGVITSVGPVATILLQTAWGTFADRTSRKGVLVFALIGSALCASLYLLNASFVYTLVIALLFTVFNMAVEPMAAAMGLDFCTRTNRKYAPLRLGGTIGYMLPGFLFAALFAIDLKYVFLIFAVLCALSCVATLLLPLRQVKADSNAKDAADGKKVSVFSIMKDPLVIFLLVSNMVAFMGSSCYTYLPLYAQELGFDNALCGQLSANAAAPEIIMFLLIDRALRKIPPKKMIIFACSLQGVRLLVTYLAGFCGVMTLPVLIAGQLIQAFTYLPCYYCAAQLIHERFPDHLKSTAQTLLAVATTGFGRILANLIGGFLSEPDVIGLQNTFLFFSVLMFLGTAVVLAISKKIKTGDGVRL